MNRNLVILFLVFSLGISAFAQNVKDTIAQETCECVSKLDTDAMNSSDLELNFGLCMLDSYGKHTDAFAENEKLDFENNAQMENFGEDIATRMLEFCPKMILKLGENLNEAPVSSALTIEGVFMGTDTKTFFNVLIKEPTGKTTKLILLDYFENAYLITDSLLKSNQEVIVTYYEAQLFDSNLNSFVTTKIITNIIKK